MVAAERGADYVMFGEPEANGRRPAFAAIVERIEWWAGVFEIPCVGLPRRWTRWDRLPRPAPISSPSAGRIWDDPRGPAAAVADAAARLDAGLRTKTWRAGAGAMSAPMQISAHGLAMFAAVLLASPAMAQPKPAPVSTEPDRRLWRVPARLYLTAFREATSRIDEKSDPKAMTLLGELYADGLGVPNDDKKAEEWYRLAAARGDREAMFALAMFRLTGRAGPQNRAEAAKLLADAAKLGHVVAAYDLALLYLEGQMLPQDFGRAAELMKIGRRGRQPAGAICAGDLLQGRPRREAGRPGSDALDRRRRPLGLHRCRGRIRHRPVQRHRDAKNERAAGELLHEGRPQEQRGRRRTGWR